MLGSMSLGMRLGFSMEKGVEGEAMRSHWHKLPPALLYKQKTNLDEELGCFSEMVSFLLAKQQLRLVNEHSTKRICVGLSIGSPVKCWYQGFSLFRSGCSSDPLRNLLCSPHLSIDDGVQKELKVSLEWLLPERLRHHWQLREEHKLAT